MKKRIVLDHRRTLLAIAAILLMLDFGCSKSSQDAADSEQASSDTGSGAAVKGAPVSQQDIQIVVSEMVYLEQGMLLELLNSERSGITYSEELSLEVALRCSTIPKWANRVFEGLKKQNVSREGARRAMKSSEFHKYLSTARASDIGLASVYSKSFEIGQSLPHLLEQPDGCRRMAQLILRAEEQCVESSTIVTLRLGAKLACEIDTLKDVLEFPFPERYAEKCEAKGALWPLWLEESQASRLTLSI